MYSKEIWRNRNKSFICISTCMQVLYLKNMFILVEKVKNIEVLLVLNETYLSL